VIINIQKQNTNFGTMKLNPPSGIAIKNRIQTTKAIIDCSTWKQTQKKIRQWKKMRTREVELVGRIEL